MEQDRETAHPSRIKYHVEKLTAVQNSVQDLNLDGRQIKLDAKDEGFNPEVITLLSQIRANHQHDNGEKILNLLVRYAQHTGIQFTNIPDTIEEDVKNSGPTERDPLIIQHTLYKMNESMLSEKNRVFLQLILAMIVSGLFLWLLH